MAGLRARGFTIIEVMLFLSISGILFVGLMVGISANINQQRYRDSVISLAGILQEQYSEVSNTRNDRDNKWRCEAGVTTESVESGQPRGTTNCLILGRYIRATDNATRLEMGDVIGVEPSSGAIIDNDQAAFAAYEPKVSTFAPVIYEPEWGSVLRNPDNQPADFSLLILRSPESGLIRAFAAPSTLPSRLSDMITSETASSKLTVCVVGSGWSTAPVQAVAIDAATAGPNGIRTTGDDNEC